jgi:CubicO group peptidase (beta-lactamase class C family)
MKIRRLALALLAMNFALVQAEEVDLLGKDGILFWSPQQQITGYRSIDEIYPTRELKSGTQPYPLIPANRDLDGFQYRFNKKKYSINDYMDLNNTAGLIAIKKGKVILERYKLGNNADSRWISFSVAKSVVSMLIGAALKDGYITSLDDPVVDYLPRLRGSTYDGVTIRNILNMASGVRWNEDYVDPNSDVARSPGGTLPLIEYLGKLPRDAMPGEEFNYSTGEANIAGALLRAAIGNNLATFLTNKIWQPFGMESDASWILEQPGGVEFGGCCINATLRDYARIGIFALRNGELPNGRKILPDHWMAESTSPSKGASNYGYYWWLLGDGVYAASGVFGQMIWIDPSREIVIAMHSAWPVAGSEELREHRTAFVKALASEL